MVLFYQWKSASYMWSEIYVIVMWLWVQALGNNCLATVAKVSDIFEQYWASIGNALQLIWQYGILLLLHKINVVVATISYLFLESSLQSFVFLIPCEEFFFVHMYYAYIVFSYFWALITVYWFKIWSCWYLLYHIY